MKVFLLLLLPTISFAQQVVSPTKSSNIEFSRRELAPDSAICDDLEGEFKSANPKGVVQTLTCARVGSTAKRRRRLCKRSDVFSKCPGACQSKRCPVCEDASSRFKVKGKGFKKCKAIGKSLECTDELANRFQGGRSVQNRCPLSCNFCGCDDFDGNFELKGVTVNCAAIASLTGFAREKKCRGKNIFSNCPSACKSKRCPLCKNAKATFRVKDKGRFKCSDVGTKIDCSESLTKRVQGGKKVRNKCPVACEFCFPGVSTGAPSRAPSGAPSGAPSRAPSGAPSRVPSGAPTEVSSEVPTEVSSEVPTGSNFTDVPTSTNITDV